MVQGSYNSYSIKCFIFKRQLCRILNYKVNIAPGINIGSNTLAHIGLNQFIRSAPYIQKTTANMRKYGFYSPI